MRAFKVIKDPKAFQLIGDETRRRMIYLLRAKEMTVSQLAEELKLTPQAIYHHIAKMREAGLIEVAREERVDHFIETYYAAAAEVFQFSHGEGALGKAAAEKEARETLAALPQLGFQVSFDDATVREIVELETKMEALGAHSELEEKVQQLDTVGFLMKQHVAKFARFAAMSDAEFDEHLRLTRRYRELLKASLAVKVPA